jgi:hypothetical protein
MPCGTCTCTMPCGPAATLMSLVLSCAFRFYVWVGGGKRSDLTKTQGCFRYRSAVELLAPWPSLGSSEPELPPSEPEPPCCSPGRLASIGRKT